MILQKSSERISKESRPDAIKPSGRVCSNFELLGALLACLRRPIENDFSDGRWVGVVSGLEVLLFPDDPCPVRLEFPVEGAVELAGVFYVTPGDDIAPVAQEYDLRIPPRAAIAVPSAVRSSRNHISHVAVLVGTIAPLAIPHANHIRLRSDTMPPP